MEGVHLTSYHKGMRTVAWVLLALTGTLATLYVAVYKLFPDALIYLGLLHVDAGSPTGGLVGVTVSPVELILDLVLILIWGMAAVYSVLRLTDHRPKPPKA